MTTAPPVVLVVDDVATNVHVLNGMLRSHYRVKVATNGAKALEIVAREAPSLILLDVMMPEMDGHEVCRRLKADATTKDIPVIFVSGHQDADERAKGMALGAVDFVCKPIKPERLLACVAKHLELR